MINFEDKEYTEEQFLVLYMNQKVKENNEKELRVKMEKALLEVYGDRVEEDKTSKQFKVGRFTINIKRSITYKLSEKGWNIIYNLPENERPVDIKYNHAKGKLIPGLVVEEIVTETKPTFTVSYQ